MGGNTAGEPKSYHNRYGICNALVCLCEPNRKRSEGGRLVRPPADLGPGVAVGDIDKLAEES